MTYDHETKPSYSVTLKADDGNGGTDTLAVTITITDVEEPPGRPAAPSVTAVDGTPTSLEVNWTAPSNTGPTIDDYDLRYREGTSGSWTNGPQNVSGTSSTIGSLTENTSYQVQVLARNDEGDSPWSPSGSGQTGALGAPDVPTSLSATRGNQEVMLSWVQPSGGAEVTGYEYEQDVSGRWISTGSTDTTTTVRNLTNGQSYTFRVRAVNSAGASAASAASGSVTVSNQQVVLIWTAPASNGGAAILRYEYELDNSGTWTSTGGTTTNTTVRNLTNGQSYTFRVRAVNRAGAGLESFSESATPTATLVAPDTPFGLSTTPGNQRVMLSWVQPSGGAALTHYEYELDLSDTWTSTDGTTTSHTVMGLTNGQSYTFRVRAVNSAGASGASGSISATPTTTEPDAPESLSFTPGDGQVTLRWSPPGNDGGESITHYEYELDGSGDWINTGSTATSHTVTGLMNGQTYVFRVRAVNAEGNGDPVTLEATPSPSSGGGGGGGPRQTVPSAPSNLLLEGGDGQVKLTWEAPENDGGSAITDYEYRIDGKGDWISIGSTDTTHTVTGLVNGQVYVFQVRAVNSNRKGRASNRVEATPRAPVTLLVANFSNGNNGAFNSRVYLWNPSTSAGQVTVRVFTLPLNTGIAQELTGPPLDLGTLEARSALNLKLVEDILIPLGIALPYTTDGGNLTLEFTIQAADVRGAAQVFSSDFAFGTYPMQEIPSTSSGSPTVLVANFTNGNNAALHSRVYLWNPSTSAVEVTVRVFTLPRTGDSSLLGTLDLESLQAESARNLKLAEDILAPLGIALPYVTDGGNLTLEFTIQAADARGTAQVFSSDFAFGTYPMQEIPSTSSESPTVLVANFMNGNDAALNSRVYLWNPSLSAGSVTVRVFTLPLTAGVAQELTSTPLDLGTLGAESARNLKLVEDILTPLGIPTPYVTDGGNLTLEFTIQAADVRGAAQVFSSSFAFGTVPLQVIQ